MPYVHIRLTGGREAPTRAQKAQLIEGVTLMQYKQKKGALGWKEAVRKN